MPHLTTQPRGPLTLTGHLLTQVEPADAVPLAAVTGETGGGLVVSGVDALKLIEYLQGRRYSAALLADRQKYAGCSTCCHTRPRARTARDVQWTR
jgi:hypothetical protein